ncbi:ribosome biogenesis protein BMS1-like [Papaver somniferum]|uniref:ribosome biogenesis protein BMS1-like n=1 Tax=Papaver somniferum TaxID=3469 RepID=UPI000E6FE58E|nr:ribosome biogenesis protein BMS1-like [Papaver somniferum]
MASSSSSNQEFVLCSRSYLKVFKTTANSNPEVSAGLHFEADDQKYTVASKVEEEEEQPPYVIVVHGPRKVWKSPLIKSLIEHYTKENHDSLYMQGLVTIISGTQRRLQFVEFPKSVNGMRDAAKYADAVILLVDAYVGFQMETFEFVNVLRVHGVPKVMGVLTSLGMFENVEKQTKTKERLTNHFLTEIREGARLFCLSGLEHGMYPKHEIRDLASFLSDMDFHPLTWRAAQPYVLYFVWVSLRGCDIKKGAKVHIAGVGDFPLFSVTSLVDPCPLLAGPERNRFPKGKEHDESKGFRSGTYLRLEVRDVPLEIVENYDPCHPILIGGISPGDEKVEYIQKDTAAINLTVEEEQPPYIIVVHGTRKVGKSTLIKSLVECYTKENLNVLYMQGPVTIISGEQRRIQFVECPNNVNGMLDAAKYADAVILLIDTYIGFEMETFEFVNILRVHGMPKVMGVLTSLDLCKNVEKLSRTKEYLMNHFRTEIYEGARIFCLSGLENGMYPKHEILDLASFISVMEFHPLSWRAAQPYVFVDPVDNGCNGGIVFKLSDAKLTLINELRCTLLVLVISLFLV